MTLKQRITDDLKAALLSGDRFATETLRGLKAAILNEEVARNKRESGLDDVEIEQIVAKEVKKRNESATLYDQAGRSELADNERKETHVLNVYLPEQLNEEEIQLIVEKSISELGASGTAAMGQVIGAVKQKVGNKADGATISRIVKSALS